MKLLIVNDEELTADTMKEVIHWDKYGVDEVAVAYNAEDVRRCINADNVDLLLCDIEMPGESGLALLKWVRDNNKTVECIFLTCHASFAYAQEAIALGCKDYILVPAKYEDIGEAVKNVVTRIESSRNESRLREFGELAIRKIIAEESLLSGEEKDPQKLVQMMKQYLLQNLGEETLTVSSVAEEFSFHPVYINRLFRKQVGVSISRYIMDERMYLAKSLLESKKICADSVAKRVGYHHYPNFFAAFKKYYGYSPSDVVKK